MRRILISLCTLICATTINAQTVSIYKDGQVLSRVIDADSVVYVENETNISLSGEFSVSSTKKIKFSSGNLQFNQKTRHWRFATNQYDFLAEENTHCGDNNYDGYIDLFGWSSTNTYFGVNTSRHIMGWFSDSGDIMDPDYMKVYSQYTGDFVDWGTNVVGETWYTMSFDEWNYLRNSRNNAENLCGVACVNGNNGLVLLPDDWKLPTGATFNPGFPSMPSTVEKYAQQNNYTIEQWQQMESAGAVFLPAAGYRDGTKYRDDDKNWGAKYWTSTSTEPSRYDYNSEPTNAFAFSIISEMADMDYDTKCVGCCVRLVCEAK
ncbi:MAG: hypothetical protein KBT10_09905 [Bacteroidales bacterium]|nr:hypothetical protein [Candidatus Sodaliphilus aphodohippi]